MCIDDYEIDYFLFSQPEDGVYRFDVYFKDVLIYTNYETCSGEDEILEQIEFIMSTIIGG